MGSVVIACSYYLKIVLLSERLDDTKCGRTATLGYAIVPDVWGVIWVVVSWQEALLL
jgi:hypothetical protein